MHIKYNAELQDHVTPNYPMEIIGIEPLVNLKPVIIEIITL